MGLEFAMMVFMAYDGGEPHPEFEGFDILKMSPERRRALAEALLVGEEPEEFLEDAKDALIYWEHKLDVLPWYQRKERKEAERMVAAWRERLGLSTPARPPVQHIVLPKSSLTQAEAQPAKPVRKVIPVAPRVLKHAPDKPPELADVEWLLTKLQYIHSNGLAAMRSASINVGVIPDPDANRVEKEVAKAHFREVREAAKEALFGPNYDEWIMDYSPMNESRYYPVDLNVAYANPAEYFSHRGEMGNDYRYHSTYEKNTTWWYIAEAYNLTFKATAVADGVRRRGDSWLALSVSLCAMCLCSDPAKWKSPRLYAEAQAPYNALLVYLQDHDHHR